MCSTSRLPAAFISLCTVTLAIAPPTLGEQLTWIGGTDTSWHTPTNWAPIVAPGKDPIRRIPQDGDTVLISDTTHGTLVQLDGDSPRLAGLHIAGGMELALTVLIMRESNDWPGRVAARW